MSSEASARAVVVGAAGAGVSAAPGVTATGIAATGAEVAVAGVPSPGPVRVGAETECLHLWFQNGRMTPADFIGLAQRLGFSGVVVNLVAKKGQRPGLGVLESDDPGYLAELAQELRAQGMFCDLDTRGLDAGAIRHALALARSLGAPIVRTFAMSGGGYSRFNTGGSFDAAAFEASARLLRPLLPEVADAGVTLAVENHELETSAEVARLVRELDSPSVRACLDYGNPMMAWEDPLAAARELAPLTVTTHVKDHVVCRDEAHGGEPVVCGCALGVGNVDVSGITRLLARQPGLRRLNLEMCHPYATPFRRPRGTGGVTRLGQGAFALAEPPVEFCAPLDSYNYEGPRLGELLDVQMRDFETSARVLLGIARRELGARLSA